MNCLKCGRDNSPDAKFCRACGDNMDEQRKAALQEKERLAQERKKQIQLWRDRLWGNRRAKIRSLATAGAALLFAVIVGVILIWRDAEQRHNEKAARTALFLQAVDSGDWGEVPELVDQGVDMNDVDNSGNTPLVQAILKSNYGGYASYEAAISLIQHGADVNAGMPIILTNNITMLSLLRSHGATGFPNLRENESYDEVRLDLLRSGWEPMSLVPAGHCGWSSDMCPKVPEVFSCAGAGSLVPCFYGWKKLGEIIEIEAIGEGVPQAYLATIHCRFLKQDPRYRYNWNCVK